jgi:hypothetical protein
MDSSSYETGVRWDNVLSVKEMVDSVSVVVMVSTTDEVQCRQCLKKKMCGSVEKLKRQLGVAGRREL